MQIAEGVAYSEIKDSSLKEFRLKQATLEGLPKQTTR
jgi:hypothetical protein